MVMVVVVVVLVMGVIVKKRAASAFTHLLNRHAPPPSINPPTPSPHTPPLTPHAAYTAQGSWPSCRAHKTTSRATLPRPPPTSHTGRRPQTKAGPCCPRLLRLEKRPPFARGGRRAGWQGRAGGRRCSLSSCGWGCLVGVVFFGAGLFFWASTHSFMHSSTRPSIHPSIYPPIHPSIHTWHAYTALPHVQVDEEGRAAEADCVGGEERGEGGLARVHLPRDEHAAAFVGLGSWGGWVGVAPGLGRWVGGGGG